jgi:hypothetical protein
MWRAATHLPLSSLDTAPTTVEKGVIDVVIYTWPSVTGFSEPTDVAITVSGEILTAHCSRCGGIADMLFFGQR